MNRSGRSTISITLLMILLVVNFNEGQIQAPNMNMINHHEDIGLRQAIASLKHISKAIEPSFNLRYPNLVFNNGTPFTFKTWKQIANLDGWVCRSHKDCDWISRELYCDAKSFNVASSYKEKGCTYVCRMWPLLCHSIAAVTKRGG